MILRFTFPRLLAIATLALAVVSGCGDDTPVDPVPSTDTTSNALYVTAPNVVNCSEGVLKDAERTKVLNYVNAIRAKLGLAPVLYRHEEDAGTAKAALIIAANSTLSHEPASSASCWSQAGFTTSGVSNLAIGTSSGTALRSSESFVDLWIKDSTITSLGHRRWLIDPFLKFISFGRVDKIGTGTTRTVSGSAIQVIYAEQQTLGSSTPEFVAFPYHETSAQLFNSGIFMSFSTIADRTGSGGNASVKYDNATVTIRTESGQSVPVTIVGSDNQGFGLPNVLIWKASVANDTRYNVTVSGVDVNGVTKTFDYWFTTNTTT